MILSYRLLFFLGLSFHCTYGTSAPRREVNHLIHFAEEFQRALKKETEKVVDLPTKLLSSPWDFQMARTGFSATSSKNLTLLDLPFCFSAFYIARIDYIFSPTTHG